MTSYQLAVELVPEELAKGSLIRLHASSDSMAPLIERGDVVLVRHVNLEDLRRGDLILLEQGGGFLIHRLVAANAHGIQIEGDSGSFFSPSLSATMIIPSTATFPPPGSSVSPISQLSSPTLSPRQSPTPPPSPALAQNQTRRGGEGATRGFPLSPCLPLSVSGFLLSLIVLAVAGALFVFSRQGRG